MRKVDESRAANYIRKHSNYKKWLAFVLCLSLLTGTVTLYILNKPATAMTEEGAESLGVVLETASNADEEELIQQTLENKVESDEGGDDDDLFSEFSEDGDDESDDELEESGDDEEKQDGLVEEEAKEGEVKEGELTEGEEQKEETEEEEDELTQDVVLTVSYVDEDGEAIAEEKEIDINDSIDLASEAPSIEGYTFKEATFKGDVITKVTVKKNADDIRYYEVTFDDDETKEIKKDAAVVLTYIKDEEEVEVDASVTLTAKYVDKDGEDIQDSEEISFAKETSMNKDNAPEIDGYFFMKAVYDGQEIVKITPVEAEAEVEAEDSDNEEETTEETEEAKTVSVEGYEFTTADGDTVEITEDAEIEYTYVKASEETEFTYSDGKVTVTATINGKNVFPEGIELKAAEVTKNSSDYNYDAYMDALNENAESIAKDAGQEQANEFTEDNTLLYDIAFVYEGKEIQPKEGTVTVKIEFKNNQLTENLSATSEEDLAVVHLPITEAFKEENEIENTEDAAGLTASDINVETLADASVEVGKQEKVEFTSGSFSIFAVITYPTNLVQGDDDFLSVLGDAVNFGIVSNDLTISGDSQSNFAVKTVRYEGHQTGNNLTNPVDQTFIGSHLETAIHLKGNVAYFVIPKERKDEYQREIDNNGTRWIWHDTRENLIIDASHSEIEVEGIIDDLFTYTAAASKDLYQNRTAGKPEIANTSEFGEHCKIDIRNQKDGTYYFNIGKNELAIIAKSEKFMIYKNPGQTVVLNVTEKGNIELNKYKVWDGTKLVDTTSLVDATGNTIPRTIIWNFPEEVNVTTTGGVVGVFITGNKNSTWLNNGTSAGWLVFPTVKISGGEWHNTYDNVVKIGETAKFQAYKKIDDSLEKAIKGFKFTLYQKDGEDWKAIESAYNGSIIKEDGSGRRTVDENASNTENAVVNPQNIDFSTITYGNDASRKDESHYQYTAITEDGQSETFTYMMKETAGLTDSEGNSYIADETVYYADVTVTCKKWSEYTKKIYYQVSGPSYYKFDDSGNKIALSTGDIPTFNNKTAEGEVGLLIHKYLNDKFPTNQKFKFTVRVLKKDNTLETLTSNLQNDGGNLSYSFKYGNDDTDGKHNINNYMVTYAGKQYLYFVITENDPPEGSGIEKDKDYIIAKVHLLNNGKYHAEVTYYKYKYDDNEGNVNGSKYIKQIEGTSPSDRVNAFTIGTNGTNAKFKLIEDKDVAFYNQGVSMLRIHKMVVNDYSSEVVRNNVNSILNSVQFRIGYNDGSGRYIYFQGLVGKPSEMPKVTATEYPEKTKTYDVYYNQGAQWTIVGIPAGDYIVEEVGDGLTFEYDPNTDTSTVLETPPAPLFEGWPILSRVTKYAVTVDEDAVPRNGSNEANIIDPTKKNTYCGVGCENRRATFSTDVSGKGDNPVLASVGGDIETVQIANYYSSPVGQIYISKKLSGGEWNDNMSFSFKLSPVTCYDITDSEGNAIAGYNTVPMPSEGGDVVTVGKADAANNRATTKFGDIKYRFEGKYVYKITEQADVKVEGVTYDETTYYVVVDVNKKYTTFQKTYTFENQTLPSRTSTNDVTEDFYYLGADVTYYSSYNEESKKCEGSILNYELYLDSIHSIPKQDRPKAVAYKVRYPDGTPVDGDLPFNVYFENFVKGKLVVKKEWKKLDGTDDQHSAPLKVKIFRRAGSGNWELFKEVELGTGNNWTWDSEKDLPEGEAILLQNAKGEKYQYCAREDDEYLTKYDVTYTYTNASGVDTVYAADGKDSTKYKKVSSANGETTYTTVDRDTVALSVAENETNYGTITITNKNIYSNALPRTGGIGDLPYLATGLGTAVAGLLGAGVYSRKKKKDDEE
jgi:LPXTG-motif cell wall-anchored protein